MLAKTDVAIFRYCKNAKNRSLQMTDDCMRTIDDHQLYYELEMVSDCWLFVRLQVQLYFLT